MVKIRIPGMVGLSDAAVRLLVAAVVVGLAAGLFGVFYANLLHWLQVHLVNSTGDVAAAVRALPWYMKLIIPTVGGLLVGPMVFGLVPEARGHGVPEVMAAVALRQGRIRGRVALVKTVASALTIGTGGSVGQEGPVVQIGGALGSKMGQWFRLPSDGVISLVGCGTAAGIAAVFNAPIAGAFFALEVILGNFAAPTFAPIVVASVTATAISRAFLGDHPAFVVPAYSLGSPWEIPLYALMGLLMGAAAVVFIHTLKKMQDLFDRIAIHNFLKTGLGGLIIGLMLFVAPELWGTGFQTITHILTGGMAWKLLLVLVPLKLIATTITLGSGGSGGLFSPSLLIGAALGGLFGLAAHALFPTIVTSPWAYAMVGMGALVAGGTHAPITAILMLFEITGNYQIIIPLMTACVVATAFATWLEPESVYTEKLAQRGISVRLGKEEIILKSHRVEDVMRKDARTLKASTPFKEVVSDLLTSRLTDRYVVDDEGHYVGFFSLHDIKEVLNDEALAQLVVAADLVRTNSPYVTPELNLSSCTDRFLAAGTQRLPVIDEQTNRVLGSVSEHDILSLYHREVLKKDFLGTLAFETNDGGRQVRDYVHLPTEYRVVEVPAPASIVGQSLRESHLRELYGVSVVAIRREGDDESHDIPNPELPIRQGDILVVVGRGASINALLGPSRPEGGG